MTLSRPYHTFPTTDKITQRDRTNVDIWARIADGDNQQSFQRTTFRTDKDVSLLHSSGFSCSFTGQTWFGKDREGHTWRVSNDSQWAKNLELSPVKPDKWEPLEGAMKLSEFNDLFSSKRNRAP